MDEDTDPGCSLWSVDHFTIKRMRKDEDDPRLREYLAIPEKEKDSSFSAYIQLISGSDELSRM